MRVAGLYSVIAAFKDHRGDGTTSVCFGIVAFTVVLKHRHFIGHQFMVVLFGSHVARTPYKSEPHATHVHLCEVATFLRLVASCLASREEQQPNSLQ